MWPEANLPTWVTMSAMMFVVVIAIIRLALIRRISLFGHLITILLVVDSTAAAFREPTIARRVAGVVPGGLPTVFDIWHWLTAVAWTCGIGMLLLHRYGPVRYRIRFKIAIGVAVVIGVVYLALSHPARVQGMSSIAEYGGWRYGIYLGLCCALPVIVVISSYQWILNSRNTVRPTNGRWDRITVAFLVLFGVITLLSICMLAACAALNAAGVGNEFTHRTYSRLATETASGESGLLVFAAVVLVSVPSSAQAVVRLLRLDRESRTARRMYPLWRDLTAAAPQVVFRLRWADSWNVTPQERLYRRRMEIHDAAEIVARYVLPLPAIVDELIETSVAEDDQERIRLVAELVLAAGRLADNGGEPADEPTEGGAEVPDEQTLLRLWQSAKSLVLAAEPQKASIGAQ